MNWYNLADIPDFFSSKEKEKKNIVDMNSIFLLMCFSFQETLKFWKKQSLSKNNMLRIFLLCYKAVLKEKNIR